MYRLFLSFLFAVMQKTFYVISVLPRGLPPHVTLVASDLFRRRSSCEFELDSSDLLASPVCAAKDVERRVYASHRSSGSDGSAATGRLSTFCISIVSLPSLK